MKNSKEKIIAIVGLSICILLGICGAVFGIVKIAGGNSDKTAIKSTKQIILDGDKNRIINSADDAYEYLVENSEKFGISEPDKSLYIKDESAAAGFKYYNFGQKYNGEIPVYGNNIIIMTDDDGNIILTSGTYDNLNENIEITAKTDEDTVKSELKEYLKSEYKIENISDIIFVDGQETFDEQHEVIYVQADSKNALAYEFDAIVNNDSESKTYHVISDANTGRVYSAWNNIVYESQTATAKDLSGKDTDINIFCDESDNQYYMHDEERNITIFNADKENVEIGDCHQIISWKDAQHQLFNKAPEIVSLPENKDWPSKAVTLMEKIEHTYDWYKNNLNIDGWNNNNGFITAWYDDSYSYGGNNAYNYSACGSAVTYMSFGYEIDLNDLDIIAHEYTHSVQSAICQMEYMGQTGAIMEAYADTMGELIEGDRSWKQSCGRNIANPAKSNNPVKIEGENYADCNDLSDDNGGVHKNSTIYSHVSYLMSNGSGDNVQPLSDAQIANLWYNTCKLVSKSDIDFYEFGKLMSSVAKKTLNNEQYRCVCDALKASGVLDEEEYYTVNSDFYLNAKDFYGYDLNDATVNVYKAVIKNDEKKIVNKVTEISELKTDTQGSVEISLDEGSFYYIEIVDEKYSKGVKQGCYIYCDDVKKANVDILTEFREDVVNDFSFSETDIDIAVNENVYIETEIRPEKISDEYYLVEWSSADESIVKVDKLSGKMTGVTEGTTEIKAVLVNKGKNDSFEKTIEQKATVTVTKKQRDTVLVLDCSGSMRGTPLLEMKKSAVKFCEALLNSGGDNYIEIITYDDLITKSGFTNNLNDLEEYIDDISDGGMTNMYSALKTADSDLNSYGRKNSIQNVVIMSDGIPNDGITADYGAMTNWCNSYKTYSYNMAESYGNAVCSIADTLKNDYNIYSLGFFHSFYDSEKVYCSYLMDYIDNSGYYEVDEAENLQISFENISGQVSDGSKIVINIACPVDVTVTYGDEKLSSSVTEYNDTASFGTLKKTGIGNDIKILELDNDKDYSISISGTGNGTMNYTVTYFNENDTVSDSRTFEKVPITVNTKITSNTSNATDTSLEIDCDGNGEIDSIWTAASNSDGEESWKNPDAIEKVTEVVVVESNKSTNVVMWIILLICCLLLIIVSVLLLLIILLRKEQKREAASYNNIQNDNNYNVDNQKYNSNVSSNYNYRQPDNNNLSQNAKINQYDNLFNNNNNNNYNNIASSVIVNGVQLLDGQGANEKIELKSGYTFAVGKDPARAKIVIDRNFSGVSRLHCTIEFDNKNNKYYITDCSSNGTYLNDGTRLEKGKRTCLNKGTVIYLATKKCRLRLL